MIRNLVEKDHLEQVKLRVMLMISRILKSQNATSIIFIVFMQLLNFFTMTSVMFRLQPLSPPEANFVFRIFLFAHLPVILGVDEQIILIIFLIITTIAIILIILNFAKQPSNYAITAMGHFAAFYQLFTIPVVNFCVQISVEFIIGPRKSTTQIAALKICFLIQSIFVMAWIILYTYFQVRPLRYNNLLWNYNNDQNFYRQIYNVVRVVTIYFDKVSIVLAVGSLIVQICIMQVPDPYLIKKINIFNRCANNLIVVVHFVIFFHICFQNKELNFITLVSGFLACVVYSSLDFWSVSQQDQQIPKCTFENAPAMYSFYIDFKTKNKITKEDTTKIGSHYLICNQKNCIFSEASENNCTRISGEELESKISQFLKGFRYDTPEGELMYELWKIQLSKSITLTHKLRNFSLIHKYIVHYVLGPQSSQISSDTNAEAANGGWMNDTFNYKWKFYKQLNLALNQFERMGEVMTKSMPQLNEIINIVIGIHYETQALNKLFQEMVKLKQVNYICVELYLKFVQCFLDEGKLSTEILDRLKKLKMLADSDSLQYNPLPCFLVESYNKTIEKVNAQALKFLKAQRYEVKDKKFDSLVAPVYSFKELQLFQQQNNKEQLIPIFFKVKNSSNLNMLCRNIKLKPIQINNRNFYEITCHKRNYNCSVIQILIDDNQNIVACSTDVFMLVYRQGKEQCKIEELYNTNIKPLLKQVNLAKIGRIEFAKNCLVSGLLIQKVCPYPQMRLLTLNLIKKMNPSRNTKRMTNLRLSKLYNSSQFGFYYHEDAQENLVLEGMQTRKSNKNNLMSNSMELSKLQQKISGLMVQAQKPSDVNYANGIKVYRLYDNDLYNIDLQDRQKYEEQFEGLKIANNNQNNKFKINENYLIAGLLLVALIIVGCSIFLQVSRSGCLSNIKREQTALLQIVEFNLNFNRIMATLRDVGNGLFSKFEKDFAPILLDSYNELQKMDESQFFSNLKYNASYDNQRYTGTLSELVEVCLTHVYQFMQVKNVSIIPKIQNLAIRQIGQQMIAVETSIKKAEIAKQYDLIYMYSLVCLIAIITLGVLYMVFFLLISHKFKKNMSSFLEPLLIVSQQQIRRISEECDKFKNAIASLYKNYQVDIQVLGAKKQVTKKRVRPKRINFGFDSILTEMIIGGFFCAILIIVSYIHYSRSSSQAYSLKKQFDEGYAIMTSYTDMVWLSNEINFTGTINQDELIQLEDKLTLIENSKNNFGFSESLSNDLLTVFFNRSCTFIQQKNLTDANWCSNSLKGFSIPNPFGINLDLYFRRTQYNLVANITDTFASTGIYSTPFKAIFKYFSGEIQQQIIADIVSTEKALLIFSILVTCMGYCLILILIASFVFYKKKLKAINYGLVALSDEQHSNYFAKIQNQKNKQEAKEKDPPPTEESDFLMLSQEEPDSIRQQ